MQQEPRTCLCSWFVKFNTFSFFFQTEVSGDTRPIGGQETCCLWCLCVSEWVKKDQQRERSSKREVVGTSCKPCNCQNIFLSERCVSKFMLPALSQPTRLTCTKAKSWLYLYLLVKIFSQSQCQTPNLQYTWTAHLFFPLCAMHNTQAAAPSFFFLSKSPLCNDTLAFGDTITALIVRFILMNIRLYSTGENAGPPRND